MRAGGKQLGRLDRATGRHGRAEDGSAFLLTLLVLMILVILGVGLSLVTQTEMRIGGHERVIQRVFYSSDSGIRLATARALVAAEHRPREYVLDDPQTAIPLQHEVGVSAFLPILDTPCNLCEINNSGTYSDRSFRRINHAVTSTALRDPKGNDLTRAAKKISAMVEFQPWRDSPDAYQAINDSRLLAEIEF